MGSHKDVFIRRVSKVLTLGKDAKNIGHRAYENCKQLIKVDLSNTALDIIHMHTFSHCAKLIDICLPHTLQEIQAEAYSVPGTSQRRTS